MSQIALPPPATPAFVTALCDLLATIFDPTVTPDIAGSFGDAARILVEIWLRRRGLPDPDRGAILELLTAVIARCPQGEGGRLDARRTPLAHLFARLFRQFPHPTTAVMLLATEFHRALRNLEGEMVEQPKFRGKIARNLSDYCSTAWILARHGSMATLEQVLGPSVTLTIVELSAAALADFASDALARYAEARAQHAHQSEDLLGIDTTVRKHEHRAAILVGTKASRMVPRAWSASSRGARTTSLGVEQPDRVGEPATDGTGPVVPDPTAVHARILAIRSRVRPVPRRVARKDLRRAFNLYVLHEWLRYLWSTGARPVADGLLKRSEFRTTPGWAIVADKGAGDVRLVPLADECVLLLLRLHEVVRVVLTLCPGGAASIRRTIERTRSSSGSIGISGSGRSAARGRRRFLPKRPLCGTTPSTQRATTMSPGHGRAGTWTLLSRSSATCTRVASPGAATRSGPSSAWGRPFAGMPASWCPKSASRTPVPFSSDATSATRVTRDEFLKRLKNVVASSGDDAVDQRSMAKGVEVLIGLAASHLAKDAEIRLPWSVPEAVLVALRKPPEGQGAADPTEWRDTTSLLLVLGQERGLLAVRAPRRRRRFLSLGLNAVRRDWSRADRLERVWGFTLRVPADSDVAVHRHYVVSACLLTIAESHVTLPAFFEAVARARETDLSLVDGILTLAVQRHKNARSGDKHGQEKENGKGPDGPRDMNREVPERHRERFHLGPLSRVAWGRLGLYYHQFPHLRDGGLVGKPFDEAAALQAACHEGIKALGLGPPQRFIRIVRADGLLWRPLISVVNRAGKLNVAPAPGHDLAWTGWTLNDGLVISQRPVAAGQRYGREPEELGAHRLLLGEKHEEISEILRPLDQQTLGAEREDMADRLERLAGPPDTPLTQLPNSLVLARFAAWLLRRHGYRSATVDTWLEGLWELIPAVLEDTHLTELTTADDLLEFVETLLGCARATESKHVMKSRIKALLRFFRASGLSLPPVNWRDPLYFIGGDGKVLRLPSLRDVRTTVEAFLASGRPDGLALVAAVILARLVGCDAGRSLDCAAAMSVATSGARSASRARRRRVVAGRFRCSSWPRRGRSRLSGATSASGRRRGPSRMRRGSSRLIERRGTPRS